MEKNIAVSVIQVGLVNVIIIIFFFFWVNVKGELGRRLIIFLG